MTGRLAAVCALITRASVIADVGCDHGLVARFCAERGLADEIIASDISEKCLNKAREELADCKNVRFICCDGIGYACDEAIIAGMGGLTTVKILKNAAEKPKTLVLCPHRDADAVRREICAEYELTADTMIKDRGKYYSIMRAERTDKPKPLDEMQTLFGAFYTKRNAVLAEYLELRRKVLGAAPQKNKTKLELIAAALDAQAIEKRS